MTTPRDDEPPRDAWLREALRHAPDADAAPPAELSAAILRQARDAVKVAARPAVSSHPLLQWWSWLARPPVAAGFATVMVATLVGVMWWDQPLDSTLPPTEPPAASAERSVAPASVTPPLAPAETPPRAEDAKSATRAEKPAPRAPASRAAPPPPAPERERQAAPTERAPADAAGELRTSGANSAPPPPAAPAPSPAPAPAATAETAAKRALAATRDEAATQRSAPAPAQALAKAAPTTATPATDQPERWTWQRDGGADPQPMTPALQRWLLQLDRAARWRPADAAPPAADGPVLQLWRDGAPRATLQVGANAAWLTRTDGPPLTAPLSPEVAASLRAALIAATP